MVAFFKLLLKASCSHNKTLSSTETRFTDRRGYYLTGKVLDCEQRLTGKYKCSCIAEVLMSVKVYSSNIVLALTDNRFIIQESCQSFTVVRFKLE